MCRISFKKIGLLLLSLLILPANICAAAENQAAIIIDDFGGDVKGVTSFLEGEIPITVAIMPFLEKATEQAKLAHENGLEVMIHLPLEPKKGKASWLGPKGITTNLSKEEINKRLQEAYDAIPYAKGLNNHMGSKAMEDQRIVELIVQFAQEKNLYLVDSGTTPKSLMPDLARHYNVPCFKRTLFLDDSLSSKKHVSKQLHTFVNSTDYYEQPIAIGHVGIKGHETFSAIKSALPLFIEKKVELVFPSNWASPEIDNNLNKLSRGAK